MRIYVNRKINNKENEESFYFRYANEDDILQVVRKFVECENLNYLNEYDIDEWNFIRDDGIVKNS